MNSDVSLAGRNKSQPGSAARWAKTESHCWCLKLKTCCHLFVTPAPAEATSPPALPSLSPTVPWRLCEVWTPCARTRPVNYRSITPEAPAPQLRGDSVLWTIWINAPETPLAIQSCKDLLICSNLLGENWGRHPDRDWSACHSFKHQERGW